MIKVTWGDFMSKPYVFTAYAGDRPLALMTEEAIQKLTHLNVAFGHVRDHAVESGHLTQLHRLAEFRSFNPGLKILLSVGGWGAGGFSEAASTEAGRKKFAATAVETLVKHGFDGIDVDWEYPCHSVAGIAASPEDKANFTLLLKEVREQLDRQGQKDRKHYLLTIAAGADQYYIDGTEMDKAQRYLDLVQIMTYDMRGGFQTLTGHHTNLYTPTGDLFRISVDASVKMFVRAGVPKEKIVIGAAFYSRMWKNVPNVNRGLHQMTSSSGGYGPTYSELAANYINRNGYTRYWDDEAKAPYLFDGSHFITYDDEESLRHKCEYVKKTGLAGIMFWEYGCDTTLTLLNAIDRGLNG
jgi:Chitinase